MLCRSLPLITILDHPSAVISSYIQKSTRAEKAATTLAHLITCVWNNPKPMAKTKMVYNTLYLCHQHTAIWKVIMDHMLNERRLPTPIMCKNIHRILGIFCNDDVSNAEACLMLAFPACLLRQCQLQWLGHVHSMKNGYILKKNTWQTDICQNH